jgi:hypothetical protein
MGPRLSRGHFHFFFSFFSAILLFDRRREHSSVPTAIPMAVARRGGQGWREAPPEGLVLDRSEHGGTLAAIGHATMTFDPRGARDGRAPERGPHLYSVGSG